MESSRLLLLHLLLLQLSFPKRPGGDSGDYLPIPDVPGDHRSCACPGVAPDPNRGYQGGVGPGEGTVLHHRRRLYLALRIVVGSYGSCRQIDPFSYPAVAYIGQVGDF